METAKTTVVNIKREPFDVYIGRHMPAAVMTKYKIQSPCLFGNPFRVKVHGPMAGPNFAIWLQVGDAAAQVYLARLELLRGKRLGCWCDHRCHGHVIVAVLEQDCQTWIDAESPEWWQPTPAQHRLL